MGLFRWLFGEPNDAMPATTGFDWKLEQRRVAEEQLVLQQIEQQRTDEGLRAEAMKLAAIPEAVLIAQEIPEEPPLIAAMKKTPNSNGVIEVVPAGHQCHCDFYTVETVKLTPSEVVDYCLRNRIHTSKLDPPDDMSFGDRAMYLRVLFAINDETRAELYKRGGFPLIRETVLLAMEKLKSLTNKQHVPTVTLRDDLPF